MNLPAPSLAQFQKSPSSLQIMMRHNRSAFRRAKAKIGMVVLCGRPGRPALAGTQIRPGADLSKGGGTNVV
jgi:hypothetical protein